MFQLKQVYKLVNMQPGEGRTVLLFVLYSLFMGVASAVFYTCTTSLFLVSFTRAQLPWAFIAGGSFVYLLGLLVQKLRQKASFTQMNAFLMSFLVLSVGGLLLASLGAPNKWIYFTLFIWNRVFVFVNGVTFWSTAGRVFSLEQSKRLFGFISMGDVISSILSYFSVPILLQFIQTDQLLFISLLFLLLCMGMSVITNRRFRAQLSVGKVEQNTVKASPVTTQKRVNKSYYSLLYVLSLLPVAGLVYVEFMFTVMSRASFPSKDVLASFLGIFFGICAVVELLIKTFLYNRLITNYSIRVGIVMLPLSLLFSYSVASLYGTFYGTASLFFAFIALSRFFMSAVRKSISDPAFQVLFQPIPTVERAALSSSIEGGPKALGNILPGLFLLLLNSFSVITMVHLSYFFLPLLVVWVVVAFRIQTAYGTILSETVSRSAALIRSKLAGNRPDVIAVEQNETASITTSASFDAMVRLAASRNVSDRIQAARELGGSGRYYAYVHLLNLLQEEEHPDVKKAALLAAGALGKPELWPSLLDYLAQDYYHNTAKAALIRVGEPIIPALTRFFNQSGQLTKNQVCVANVVSEIGGPVALRFLRPRINYPVQVVRDAIFDGLKRLHHRVTSTERPTVMLQLDEQIALLVWLAASRLDLAPAYDRASPIVQALNHEKETIVPKVFTLLIILYGNTDFEVIGELITHKNSDMTGYLIELLNTALPAEVKDRILPLFAEMPLSEKLRRCSVNYPQQQLTVEERLHDIINKDFNNVSAELKAVAVHALLDWHETDPTAILVANVASSNELLAETAFYVLHKLNPTRFEELCRVVAIQPDSMPYQLANRMAAGMADEDLLLHQRKLLLTDSPQII
ncbi:HEAT repeat domain-containing protein [Spirosoma jeollabukense]